MSPARAYALTVQIMEVLRGTAVGVRHAIDVSGDRSAVSTRHRAVFRLGAVTVTFNSAGLPVIEEGDRVAVAGRVKGRLMIAQAYVNETAGVRGDAGRWANFAGMIFCLLSCCGLLLGPLWAAADPDSYVIFWPLALIFAVAGLVCAWRWLRISRAVRLVSGG